MSPNLTEHFVETFDYNPNLIADIPLNLVVIDVGSGSDTRVMVK